MMDAGWLFDWNKSSGAVSQKIAYLIADELQGLVEFERVPSSLYNVIYLIEVAPHNVGKAGVIDNVAGVLFAYVAQDSLNAGFEGFVMFYSKTILVDHYIEKYGAKVIHDNQLMFDTAASEKLIQEYLEDSYDSE